MNFPLRITVPELDELDRIARAFEAACDPRSLTPEEAAAVDAREAEMAAAGEREAMRGMVRASMGAGL